MFWAVEFVFCPGEKWKEVGAPSRFAESTKLDTFSPDFKKFPEFAEAGCVNIVVSPEDLIYWPSHWWHQSYVPAPNGISASLSGMHLDKRYNEKIRQISG